MAEITEKILEIKAKVEGEATVKDLKEQIAELTRLMDTLDKESAEYADTVNLLVDAEEELTNAMKVGKSQLSAQEGSYNALVNRMAALKKTHKAVTDEMTRNSLSEEINKINTQLKEMDAQNGVYVRNVGDYENAIKSALKTPQQELKALRAELAQLTEGTAEYNAVFARMSQLTHDVAEQQELLKLSSADLGDIIGNVAGVATSLAGGFSAFTALGSLIGGESEEIEKAMLQTQRFIQLIQGLEQFEQLGKKVENLWTGIKNYASGLNEANETLEEFKENAEEAMEAVISATGANNANTASTAANTTTKQASTVAENNDTTATDSNTAATQANTAATNAQSAANVVATTTTGLFSAALGVLKAALISTGIGAIIVLLGSLVSLLGDGLGALWNWISGATKAKEQTETLQNSFKGLEERLGEQDKAWKRQEALMKAQGKSYEEIYEAQKKYLKGKLAETQATLAVNQAIAKEIGEKNLQKKKYEEFRKTLDELVKKEKELQETISNLDYDKHIKDVEEDTKRTNELAEAKKKAAEAAQEAHKKEKESAEKLYKDLVQYYKDEKTKLKEKYEEEKKLLEKFGQDTTLLTQKYEEEKTKIVLKEAEIRKKQNEQIQKDFDASFKSGSVEDFENKLNKATTKLEDFKKVDEELKNSENQSPEEFAKTVSGISEKYGIAIYNMEHFSSILKQVQNDFDDADNALKGKKSDDKTDDYNKRIEEINNRMNADTEKMLTQYELETTKSSGFLDAFTNNSITQMYKRWETEDAIFNMRKERLTEQIKLYKEMAEDETLTDKEREVAKGKVAELEQQLDTETANHTIAQNERRTESVQTYVEAVQSAMNGVSDILGTVASNWESSIQAQVDAGEISQEEADEKMEEVKKIQSAQALINTFSSAVSAYQSMAGIPFVGPALGVAAAAAAIASGMQQVKAINAVKKGDKGGSGGESTRYAEVTPNLPDYNPTAVTNVTGGQETENLANAMSNTPIWVSVKDIDSAQGKVKTRDRETSF